MDHSNKELKVEILTKFLFPGIILKGDAYTLYGQKIWNGGQPLSGELISWLKQNNIQKIYYTRPALTVKKPVQAPMIDEKLIQQGIDIYKEMEKAIQDNSLIPEKGINEVVEGFINNISNFEGTVLNLLELKEFDEYTYTHSINVCLISILFAKRLNYNTKGLKVIGVGALLHDIGKMLIPIEIINKPVSLTSQEYEIMKKHPIFGYEIIKSQSNFGTLIQKVVLFHHERYDGKGYPFGLRGEQIGEIAQIVSIADVFDAITSERAYKPARPYWYALTYIKNNSIIRFSPRLARSFSEDMPRYLTEEEIFKKGTFVVLNTGEVGEVIDHRIPQTLKPIVNIYINARKEIVRYPISVDLEFDDTRSIYSLVEDQQILIRLNEIKDQFIRKKTQTLTKPIKPKELKLKDELDETIFGSVDETDQAEMLSKASNPIDMDLFADNESDLK